MSRRITTFLLASSILLLAGCDSSAVAPDGGSSSGDADLVARGSSPDNSIPTVDPHVAAIHELQSAFHGALNGSDYDAIRSLWTEDATLDALTPGGPVSASGPDEIADFFASSGPFVNGWAALAPTYKTTIEIRGNRADFGFECIYVEDTGNLAGQTVVAHLNATGVMRKVGDRWLFERFQGGVGPLS